MIHETYHNTLEVKEGMRLSRKEREMRVLLGARTEALLTSPRLRCGQGQNNKAGTMEGGEEVK